MKTSIIILSLTFLTLSCKDNNKSVTKNETPVTEQDGLDKTASKKSRAVIGIIYETENFKLYGDSTIDQKKLYFSESKFEPYIEFNDFKVDLVDHKKYAVLDLNSNKSAKYYRTRLREGYRSDTANFAGHYTFTYWGCGSPCLTSYIIDRKTGKIYDVPSSSLGYEFRVDSRMLIVNPPDTSGYYGTYSFDDKPQIFIFDERTKTFNERKGRGE